ncbi:MAG: FAD-dependent oxidoreductase [Acidimicrobiia bacterium]|nr:FAD-dependent oxidoreductase [Acidimicrobiia bacterium]
MNVTVIGAGVIGLTSAIRLREAGFDANIVAAELPIDTVASSVAGAIWYPYGSSADAPEAGWGRRSLEVFTEAARTGLPGLAVMDMVELLAEPGPDPWWADPGRGFRRCEPAELRAGFVDGYLQETAVIDVVPHLGYLGERFVELGGQIARQRVEAVADIVAADHLAVNCAGVGAGKLVDDHGVQPIQGQVVRVRGVRIDRVTMVHQGPLAYAYVMPHGDEAVLGGTRRTGRWDRTPDDAVTEHLLEKAMVLEPSLVEAEVIGVKVGLRPGRHRVRLEREVVAGTPGIIHNYGHDGNGWSLSWGCADKVVDLAAAVRP